VVAYALAGTVDIDLTTSRWASTDGQPVYLRDIWPTRRRSAEIAAALQPEMFRRQYATSCSPATKFWQRPCRCPEGDLYAWDPTQHLHPGAAVTCDLSPEPAPLSRYRRRGAGDARRLITTDHISPAGSIAKDSPAGST
jgi:aconitate hydratase